MNSDVQIAGDPLAIPHLLPPVPAHPATVAGFVGLARSIAADRAAWAPLVRYDATTRWYHRLRTGPGYEVWLLSWVPGQGSGRHDHGLSSGVLTVLEGELTEHATVGTQRTQHTLKAGRQRVFAPGLRPRGRQRRPDTRRQPAHLLPGPDRYADASPGRRTPRRRDAPRAARHRPRCGHDLSHRVARSARPPPRMDAVLD